MLFQKEITWSKDEEGNLKFKLEQSSAVSITDFELGLQKPNSTQLTTKIFLKAATDKFLTTLDRKLTPQWKTNCISILLKLYILYSYCLRAVLKTWIITF